MKLIRTVWVLIFPLCYFSCAIPKPLPNYLEHVNDSTGRGQVVIPELKIQKNDILAIQIYSDATDPRIDEVYNLPATASGLNNAATATTGGLLVDARGDIQFPKLGMFHAEGLTKAELAAAIRKRLTEPDTLLRNPVVLIRFLNLKVTVLGEVSNQGVINFPGERVTVLEAIGLAGGVTEFGLKNSVKVMRETGGQRETGYVDLTSEKLFESPFYNLMPNDVVLVDPSPRKAKKTEQDVVLQRVSFGLSVITAIALVYNIFK